MIVPILQFILAKGSGEAALKRFLTVVATSGDEAAQALCASVQSLMAEVGILEDVAGNIVDAIGIAEELAEDLANRAVDIIWIGHRLYPKRLARILGDDAPPVLYACGNKELLNTPSVGFCGSRKATEKGLSITERCAAKLSADRICIVSGYAHGVDMAAHSAAMANQGTTVIVLAEGILRFQYKSAVSELLAANNHLIVSQFSPRLRWYGRNAMKRNSTIIGLSDAMILVESGRNGGTFAAGEETLRLHRPLFVIDFAEPGQSAQGNSQFIQRGGVPIRGDRDGVPNLDKVRSAVKEQSWRDNAVHTLPLFSWNQQGSN